MNKPVLGNQNERIIVFYTFTDVREFNKFKQSMDLMINPKVLHSTVFVVFLENESDKNPLPQLARFNYFCKSDLNFFGQFKDKQLGELMKAKYDQSVVFGAVDEKQVKRINKVAAKTRIVTNSTENLKSDISIKANAISIEQIVNFAKETLEKIQP
jgi:hypothetical protein